MTSRLYGLLLTVPLALPAVAQTQNWQLIGQIGGATQAVAVQGHYAYVGFGLRLVVLDVSDPAAPREVGVTRPFPHFVEDIAVSGTLAYVAAGGAGLRVVDVSDPAAPVEVGALDTRGYANGVAVSGTTAYLAGGPYGLRVIDVSKPSQPVEVGSAYVMNYAFGVALDGRYAYIAAAGAGLLIAEVSDPKRPVEVGSLNTTGYAYGIAVSRNTVYVADGWEGIKIVDVKDPAHPVQIGAYQTPGWAFGVSIQGGSVFVADAFRGLRVLDVVDPARPVEVASSEMPGGHAARVTVAENIAWVADRNHGIRALTLGDSSPPIQVGIYAPLGYAHDVAVAGNHALVAAGRYGFRVIDISNPAAPVEVGAYDTQSYALKVVVAGDYAYVATLLPGKASGLHVVDIRDPARPVRAGFVRNSHCAFRDLAVAGNVAYLPDECGLETFDISNPRMPRNLAVLDLGLPNATCGIAVNGDVVYLATEQRGLELVNVSNPAAPVWMREYRWTDAMAQKILISGGYAYVADGVGLAVLDLSDPAQPALAGRFNLPQFAEGIELAGSVALVANGGSGVREFDVSARGDPQLVTTYHAPGYAQSLVASGGTVYVADQHAGLLILRKTPVSGAAGGPVAAASHRPARFTAGALSGAPGPRHAAGSEERSVRPQPLADSACKVANTADQGLGTLRWCLGNAANGTTITFDSSVFPPDYAATIGLSSPLLLNQGGVTIDGSNAGVILDGGAMPQGAAGLVVSSDVNTIRGLQILRCPGAGVSITGAWNTIGGDRTRGAGPFGEGNLISGNGSQGIYLSGTPAYGNVIIGNLIGTDAGGASSPGNGDDGIRVDLGAPRNRIGGSTAGERNVVGGNRGNGVSLWGGEGNVVVGNYIGVDVRGTAALGNRRDGIFMPSATGSRIGGMSDGERNVIGANGVQAIELNGAYDNLVAGNYLGLNASGSDVLGNAVGGVSMVSGSYRNVVVNNVIAAGQGYGVLMNDWNTSYNTMVGNLVGTDATGTKAFPNGAGAVWIGMGAGYNRIGGSTAAERNVLAGPVTLTRQTGPGNLVTGNFIGTNRDGTRGLGLPGAGIDLSDGSRRPFIGGTAPGEGNVISGNQVGIRASPGADYSVIAGNNIGTDATGTAAIGNRENGIDMYGEHSVVQGNRIAFNSRGGVVAMPLNTIRANSILGNSMQGISGQGVENGGMPAPVLTLVTATSVSGASCAGCEVEIFSASANQGDIFEGATTSGASGAFTFTKSKPLAGPNVTATATDPQGNTSEFSIARAVPK
ncbi:MAG: hypothetical protein LAQ69_34560 [Acidobacteriia bacterium]|nr:hypothetical protein [Terriglobia bacterium]